MERKVCSNTTAGFTLVEVIVVMAVFLTVIMIASDTFKTIITYASKYSKSEESNIEGIIGLEVMRHDLEQMGFGLFWGYVPGSSVAYSEATTGSAANDAPGVPRAFVGSDAFGVNGSDFFAIKATTVGRAKASQRWTYAPFQNFSAATGVESRPISWPSNNLMAGDRVIAIRSNFNDSNDDHLLLDSSGTFWFSYSTTGSIVDEYLPVKDQQVSMIYGLTGSSITPRMPFNRSDYFVSSNAGTVPSVCAPDTGVLYKATVNHDNGGYTYIPLIDCVADMQVVLGWDTSDGGKSNFVSAYSNLTGDVVNGGSSTDIQSWLASPQGVREHLKMVKIFFLVQEGKYDAGYTYPSTSIVIGGDGEASLTSTFNFTTAQRKFNWKLYRLIVRPKNLISNQR